jgi:hypothetical protein
MDSRYPYILGSYKLVHEARRNWTGSAIANINFEYTALRQMKLNAVCFPGADPNLNKYLEYAPRLTGGFDGLMEKADSSMYLGMSWCDAISYHTAGIPAYTNDIMSEQMFQGVSPYIGRDHSNMDNWDVFDMDALMDNASFYGGLGIFIDSMPYILLDFGIIARQIKNEMDANVLEDAGILVGEYIELLSDIESAGALANSLAEERNGEYFAALGSGPTEEERKIWFKEARRANETLLSCYKVCADDMFKINAMDFLCVGSSKHTGNIKKLKEAVALIKEGKVEESISEGMAYVDLALTSYYFSEEVAEHMRAQICAPEYADKRTWARGRELNCLTHYKLIDEFNKKVQGLLHPKTLLNHIGRVRAVLMPKKYFPSLLADVITMMEQAAHDEALYIPPLFENEKAALKTVLQKLNAIK